LDICKDTSVADEDGHGEEHAGEVAEVGHYLGDEHVFHGDSAVQKGRRHEQYVKGEEVPAG
jgi:hypothetical protein